MDVLSLPVNVQRRIALLLEDPDVTVADIDTVANRDVQRHMPDQLRRRSSDGPEGGASWVHDSGSKTHAIAAELNSASAAVVDTGYLGSQHLQAERVEAEQALQQGRQARLGGGKPLMGWESNKARGDQMVWLKRHEQVQLGHTALVCVMDSLLKLQEGLAQHWDVMGTPSFQLAMYPGNGARYVRHADASESSPARSITAIYYLNPDWDEMLNGGKLCLYHKPTSSGSRRQGEQATLVAPAGDTLVVFDSRMEHEVLPTFADRDASRKQNANVTLPATQLWGKPRFVV